MGTIENYRSRDPFCRFAACAEAMAADSKKLRANDSASVLKLSVNGDLPLSLELRTLEFVPSADLATLLGLSRRPEHLVRNYLEVPLNHFLFRLALLVCADHAGA